MCTNDRKEKKRNKNPKLEVNKKKKTKKKTCQTRTKCEQCITSECVIPLQNQIKDFYWASSFSCFWYAGISNSEWNVWPGKMGANAQIWAICSCGVLPEMSL